MHGDDVSSRAVKRFLDDVVFVILVIRAADSAGYNFDSLLRKPVYGVQKGKERKLQMSRESSSCSLHRHRFNHLDRCLATFPD